MSRHHPVMPIAVTILAVALLSVMDAVMKRASIAGGVYSALLLRSVMAAGFMTVVWRWRGGRLPAAAVLRLHALRGAVSAGMAATFFFGLVRTPMAQGIALSFIAPLVALWLAAVMLGERIRRAAVGAALLGFVGVLAIVAERIGDADLGGEAVKGIAAILVSALLYAWNLVLQRQQAQVASPAEVALFQNAVVALVMLPLAPWLWVPPQGTAWGYIAAAAVLITVSLVLLAWAYARAEAQVLVPLEYTAFGWAALMGWWWFGEGVSVATLAGLALILAGCWVGTRSKPPEIALSAP